jgi:predicted O-linked N-acetylglucosamine transferase (SPINDLY family)
MSPKKLQQILDQAVAHHRAGRLHHAAEAYCEFLRFKPDHADALHLLGLTAQAEGNHARAVESFAKAIRIEPKAPLYRLNRGRSLRALGQTDAAIEDFRAAVALQPTLSEAHHQLGNALKSLGRYAEATPSLREAVRLAPNNAAVWFNLGVACLETKAFQEAISCFRQAIRLKPDDPEAQNILGHAFLTQGMITDAKRHLTEALRLQPGHAHAHNNLARALRTQGRQTEAVKQVRASLEQNPNAAIHSNLLYSSNFLPDVSPEEIWTEHRRWAGLYADPLRATWRPHQNDFTPGRRLRIGYVSPDLVNHAVSFFLEPVLIAHDREQFEVFAYSNALVGDRVTERLRAQTAQWRDIAQRSDESAAALIRQDRIDILVDLAGHTARNRLLVFARKPAPVQVTWLGYPNTTGLTAIDYRITESVSDPAGQTEEWHSEQLVRLPGPFSCYLPPAASPPVAPLPALASGHITFGCFNNFAKVTARVVELWARLLREMPGARLFLKSNGVTDPETAAQIHEAFAQHGISPDRIELNGDRLSVAEHLNLYRRIDIALDPFPYNGTTATCESLWMGAPVVTLAGRTHVSRVGASLLTHLGAPEWIAATPDEYATICARLAADISHLASIRQGLRERLQSSPLCDAACFTRNLESAFRTMWTDRCRGTEKETGLPRSHLSHPVPLSPAVSGHVAAETPTAV